METCFAPAERREGKPLLQELEFVSSHSLIKSLLDHVGGILAVLNEHRQVLAVNQGFLTSLGVENPDGFLGLRLGEILECRHAHDMPGGCGTSLACSSCGAALAIVAASGGEKATERTCCITIDRNGYQEDLFLRVQARPSVLDGRKLILLFLQDMTYQQKWALLERVFFHDLNNLVSGLTAAVDLLQLEPLTGEAASLTQSIERVSARMAQEIALQRLLVQKGPALYQPVLLPVAPEKILEELQKTFTRHPAAQEKRLQMVPPPTGLCAVTDQALLLKVLGNMVLNALEAGRPGETIRFGCESQSDVISFWVWNPGLIPPEVAVRIFQRNFSTKADLGRGLGTYSMKLFGEGFLKGRIGFSTSPAEGTCFHLDLPYVHQTDHPLGEGRDRSVS